MSEVAPEVPEEVCLVIEEEYLPEYRGVKPEKPVRSLRPVDDGGGPTTIALGISIARQIAQVAVIYENFCNGRPTTEDLNLDGIPPEDLVTQTNING